MRPSLALLAFVFSWAAMAADTATISLTIRNRAFEPNKLEVPAGQKIELHIRNADTSASEFESFELHREKVVTAGQEIVVYIRGVGHGAVEGHRLLLCLTVSDPSTSADFARHRVLRRHR